MKEECDVSYQAHFLIEWVEICQPLVEVHVCLRPTQSCFNMRFQVCMSEVADVKMATVLDGWTSEARSNN